MSDQIISCPKCDAEIPLNDALSDKIRHQIEKEFAEDVKKKESEFAEKVKKQEEKFLKESKKKEEDLNKKINLLEEGRKNIDLEVAKKMEDEKRKMWKIAQEKAGEKLELEMKSLKDANKEKEIQLDKMREHELALRKEKREMEEEKRNMKIEIERKLDVEREKIAEEARKNASEEMRLKMLEKDKQMEQLRKSLDDAKRKSEQGSMQIQGDVQENDLKNMLSFAFPMDLIEDVPTGVKGADLIQTVNSTFGQKAGIILWESKNTKAWSKDWIPKLKDDQSLVKADVCVLISQTLPDSVKDFKFEGGVWICSYNSAMSLINILRLHLIQVNKVKQSLLGKDEKMELLYSYLSGNEFQNRMENIVSAFTVMQSDLETEKRSMNRIWSKREKEINRVIMSTSGMYGDLQGIIGAAALPSVDSLDVLGEE